MAKRAFLLLLFLLVILLDPTKNIQADDSTQLESYEYKAEVTRLMDIIINYLYTQKDRFMRELVSNSVDALEKLRLHSISNSELMEGEPNFDIYISADKDKQTITIRDTGIGMTKTELIDNLGTVAKSGTTNFLEAMAEAGDINLIGQFGVGFYSAFLVADKVTVYSKSPHDVQYIWESSADAKFTIQKDPEGNTLGRGTKIVLHVKQDATEFLEVPALINLLNKFSQFMPFPIYIWKEGTIEVDKEPEVAVESDSDKTEETNMDDESQDKQDVVVDETDDQDGSEKPATPEKITKTIYDWEHVNTQKPIWLRPKSEISDEEYITFYATLVKDSSKPLSWTHFSAEGEIDFKALLYIPESPPSDFYDLYANSKAPSHLKLYARRVLVSDTFDELLPKYLSFIKGVIDSDDIPLNVSREQLQEQKVLKSISKKITRKILELFKDMHKESQSYKTNLQNQINVMEDGETKDNKIQEMNEETLFDKFWSKFGTLINIGCYEEASSTEKISGILQFNSNKNPSKYTDLESYVANMQENQNMIYYISGESIGSIIKSPLLQVFNDKDIEVLYIPETVGEACLQKLGTYKEKKIASIQKEKLELPEDEEEKLYFKKVKKMYKPLIKWFNTLLTGKVKKVELSKSLIKDPCAIVSSTYGYSAAMEKSFKVQTFVDKNFLDMVKGMRVFQINPNHPVMLKMLDKVNSDENANTDRDLVHLGNTLYQTALISSGFDIEDSEILTKQIYDSISKVHEVDFDAPVKSIDVSHIDLNSASSKEDESNMPFEEELGEMLNEADIPASFSSINPQTGMPDTPEYAENLEKLKFNMNSQDSFPTDEL